LAYIEQYRAWLSFLSGDLDVADTRLHRAAATLGRLGDRNGVGWANGLLAFVRFYERRLDEAEDLATRVRSEAAEQGNDWAVGMMLALQAELRLSAGALDEAYALADQARSRFRKSNDAFGLAQALSPLVRVQVALGRYAAAERTGQELLAIGEESPVGPLPMVAVASAAMQRGDGRSAWTLTQRAIPLLWMRAGSGIGTEARMIAAIAAAQRGRLNDASSCLAQLTDVDRRHPLAHAAAALVAALRGEPAVAVAEGVATLSDPGSNYLQRSIAAVGAASGHALDGDLDAARAVVELALDEALRVGDVVMTTLLQRVYHRVIGVAHRSGSGDLSVLASGWVAVADSLPVSPSFTTR
jgi:hypothetical protein